MKNVFLPIALAVMLLCSGCNEEGKRVSRETAQMTVKFNELVKGGKTTREQEKAFIDAMASVCFELDRSIRGTKAAERTKRNTEIEAKTGINPEGPLELNMDDKYDRQLLDLFAIVERAGFQAHETAQK